MAGGYISNAGAFLVDAVFGLYIFVVLLRFVLQLTRADFYNPISQAIVAMTNPPLRPMRRYIPSVGGVDTSSVVLLLLLQTVDTWLVTRTLGYGGHFTGILITAVAELISKCVYLYIFAVIIQVAMSWVSPGAYNHLTVLLDTITRPLMRPVRRHLPATGGLDFSPLVVILALQLALILIVAPIRDLGRIML